VKVTTQPEDRKMKAMLCIKNQLRDLVEIRDGVRADLAFDRARERLMRWKVRTVRLLGEKVHPSEGEKLHAKEKSSFIAGAPLLNFEDEVNIYSGFLWALLETVGLHPQEVLDAPLPPTQIEAVSARSAPPSSRTVFIVHGHDELNLLRLKGLLQDRWQLSPIVLSAQAGRGRTLIEKFEQEAQRAAFALVLLTPDDTVSARGVLAQGPQRSLTVGDYAQARPNVLFELGWFYGRLGRERVWILFRQGTTIHTDLDGISRIEFVADIRDKATEIERELVAAGLLKAV